MIEVFMTLVITAVTCSLLGSFLLLRNLSMVCDALSHSVLLGIVLAFIIVKDLNSIYLIIGAGLFGVLTVWVVEKLSQKGLVKNDDALGIIFPLFFSIAVIIISKFFRNVHLDVDIVLMGEVLLVPFKRMFNLPRDFVVMLGLFIINSVFVIVFYRALKILSFDKDYAFMQSIKINALFYSLMTLTSVTSVAAFNTAGAILVISLFIAPSASAFLIAKSLKQTILLSMLFSVINVSIGFILAISFNMSVAGMCSFVGMITCLMVIVFGRNGIIVKSRNNINIKKQLNYDLILIHLYRHKNNLIETGINSIDSHLNWDKQKTNENIDYLINENLVEKNDDMYILTKNGIKYVENMLRA